MRTKKENIQLIKALSNANGVSGFEDEVAQIGHLETKGYCHVREDSLRNVYMELKTNTGKKPRVWLDAHSDEVGFIVQAIKPNGTLTFLPLGGWDARNVPSSKVRVLNAKGDYLPGIVATKPVHFLSEAERHNSQDISNMVIDMGAVSKEDLDENFKIRIGAPIVPDVDCSYDEKRDLFMGKAFDCRIGCASLIETLNQLQDEKLDVDVFGTLSVQEEVGERGMEVCAKNVEADIAIIFEGCPADDTFYEPYLIQAGLKKGPMLRHFDRSMITNPRFMRYALDLGEEKNIPVQEAVRSGGGTNAKFTHLSKNAIPTIVIGVPVRYTHSHHCFTTYEDYQNAIKLAVEIIKSLDQEIINQF